MRFRLDPIVLLAILGCGLAPAVLQGAAEPAPAAPRISLMTVGKVDTALRERVTAYIFQQYRVHPELRKPAAHAPDSVEGMRSLLVRHTQPEDVCLLALCAAPEIDHEGMIFHTQRCGAINVAALQPAEGAQDDSAEQLARRVEKESLRAIAMIVGIKSCPFLRCALFPHTDEKGLDAKSRNPCPPCLAKIRGRLKELGLTLLPEYPPLGDK